jgi:hypothetical protein
MLRHSPRAFPWEKHLPWALVRVRESTAARPEGADRARGIACAKVVGASISRGVGTSATARIRNAGGRSTAGKRRGGKPDIASTPTSKPVTPRLRKSAASERSPRLRLLRTHEVTSARGHAAEIFFPLRYAIGRAATTTLRTRTATPRATAALSAGKLFAMSRTGNASGSPATPRMGGRSGP